jgi:membrane associated rhomboid family serine protease
MKCDYVECEENLYLPFKCRFCGKNFCKRHRLPENHACTYEVRDLETASREDPAPVASRTVPPPSRAVPGQAVGTGPGLYLDPPAPPVDGRSSRRDQRAYRSQFDRRAREPGVRGGPIFLPNGKTNATFGLIIANIIGFILYYTSAVNYILISLEGLSRGYVWTLFSATLVPPSLISVIFAVLIIWFMGKNIEITWGPKFMLTLYFVCGLATAVTEVVLLFAFSQFPGLEGLNFVLVSAQGGIFLGLITFFIYLRGLDASTTVLFFFIPITLTGRKMLIFLIGFNLVLAVVGLFGGITMTVTSLGACAAFFGGYYMRRSLR